MTTTTMVTEAIHEVAADEGAPSRKERRKAEKAAAKLERKLAKARKKAWKKSRPKGQPWVSPILWVSDVRAHAHWCERAFGFEVSHIMEADGKAQHAELRHRRGTIMLGLAKEHMAAPTGGKMSVTQYVYVADVDELAERAAAAGGKLAHEVRDEPWGDRCVPIVDPEGHSWMFATHRNECAVDQPPPTAGTTGDADERQASA